MRVPLPLLLLLVPLLAGCSEQAADTTSRAAGLDWVAMDVATVPLEPWEARGQLRIQWTDDGFAFSAIGEGGMPSRAIRVGDLLYVTGSGMGWTRWSFDDYVAANGRGFRYVAMDVPALLEGQPTEPRAGGFTVETSFEAGSRTYPVTVEVDHDGPTIREVRVTTPADPESPYTLRPAQAPLPFPAAAPKAWMAPGDVAALEAEAVDTHAVLLGWIDAYVERFGRVPAEVTAQSLAVQRLNQPWPASPFDGEPMQDVAKSGHFDWKVCDAQNAKYSGFGFDGQMIGKAYGGSCN